MLVLNNQTQGFLDSVYVRSHSKDSVKSYSNGLRKFEVFLGSKYDCKLETISSQINDKKIDVYELLRDFVIDQDKQDYNPTTIEVAVNAVKGYLRYCGIRIYSEDYKQVVKMPKKIKTHEDPITKELLVRLLQNVSPKLQTIILVATSSGMRIGELVQITISDIDFESNPTKIKIRAETTKTKESRETFLTQEATKSLKGYLKKYFGWEEGRPNNHISNTMIFGRTSFSNTKIRDDTKFKSHVVSAAKSLLQVTLENSLKKTPDLNIRNEDGRFVIHFHGFRKFFRTTVGNAVGRDYAEALIGHSFYMDTYYNLPPDKKLEMYLDAEPFLTISDFQTVEKKITNLSSEYGQLKKEFDDLKQYLITNSIPVPSPAN